jgi:hypothetical protein
MLPIRRGSKECFAEEVGVLRNYDFHVYFSANDRTHDLRWPAITADDAEEIPTTN